MCHELVFFDQGCTEPGDTFAQVTAVGLLPLPTTDKDAQVRVQPESWQ
jgi:hypothetical protein